MKPSAKWTNDCQGKRNCDKDLVVLSTRYWPQGDDFTISNAFTGEEVVPNNLEKVKPSAESSIYIQDELVLKCSFEGETEEDVKAQVERWANEQVQKIKKAVRGVLTI